MDDRGVRIGILGLTVLFAATPTGWGRIPFETQVKTVTVVDVNGVPVPDARVYSGECLVWDGQRQTVRLADEEPWQRTDANGTFSFEFVRQGSGRSYFITDDSFERMTSLYIARKDPNETYTVQLEKPARIKGVIKSDEVPFSDIHVNLYYHQPEKRTCWPLLSGDYHVAAAYEMSLDLLCPAGCHLILNIQPQTPGIRDPQRHREVAPLEPGQVLDLSAIELRPVSGFKSTGRLATELQIGEWVKGEPVTLDELKGQVVLLDFWGLWCSPCRRAMPKLAEVHEKYASDGLVIIAIHDASLSKEVLLNVSPERLDLSGLPFRVAIDAMPEGGEGSKLFGKGETTDAYGVSSFPTVVLIDREGMAHLASGGEEQLYQMLYGRPMTKPTTKFGRFVAAHRPLAVRIAVATGLMTLLVIVFVGLWLRRSRIEVGRP